ncbi:hypothetical protein D3C72_2296680 [compost metagenome]
MLQLWLIVEILQLLSQCILLAIGPIQWVMVGEELFGVGLLNLPRRVAQHGIETFLGCGEYIRKLQLPVEKAQTLSHCASNRQCIAIRLVEISR